MSHFMIVSILYINVLNLSWKKKMCIFEEYRAFKYIYSFQIDLKCIFFCVTILDSRAIQNIESFILSTYNFCCFRGVFFVLFFFCFAFLLFFFVVVVSFLLF